MKTPMIFLLATLSFSALAQVNGSGNQQRPNQPIPSPQGPCHEFDQNLTQAERQVNEYDKEVRMLEAKLDNTEQRLDQATRALSGLMSQRDRLSETARSSAVEASALRADQSRFQIEALRLSKTIQDKENLRQFHVAQASSERNLEIKREHLRQSKILEKEIEALRPQLTNIENTSRANALRANQLDQQSAQQSQQLAQVSAQLEQAQRSPEILRLQSDRAQLINDLSDSQVNLDRLNDKVVRATSNVNMCYGYIELSVKYPAALKISRKLVNKGCRAYIATEQGGELENEAQDEILAAACR